MSVETCGWRRVRGRRSSRRRRAPRAMRGVDVDVYKRHVVRLAARFGPESGGASLGCPKGHAMRLAARHVAMRAAPASRHAALASVLLVLGTSARRGSARRKQAPADSGSSIVSEPPWAWATLRAR